MFGNLLKGLKASAEGAANRLAGNTDQLEAGFAIAARAAAADGTISEDEIVAAIEAAQGIDTLKAAFTPSQLEAAAMKQFDRAKTLMGRNALKRELEDIRGKDQEYLENAFMIGAMAADAVGGIGAEERQSLLDSARLIGLNNATELLAA